MPEYAESYNSPEPVSFMLNINSRFRALSFIVGMHTAKHPIALTSIESANCCIVNGKGTNLDFRHTVSFSSRMEVVGKLWTINATDPPTGTRKHRRFNVKSKGFVIAL